MQPLSSQSWVSDHHKGALLLRLYSAISLLSAEPAMFTFWTFWLSSGLTDENLLSLHFFFFCFCSLACCRSVQLLRRTIFLLLGLCVTAALLAAFVWEVGCCVCWWQFFVYFSTGNFGKFFFQLGSIAWNLLNLVRK